MKESKLKSILTKPTIDESMDQNIRDSLLDIESHSEKMTCKSSDIPRMHMLDNKFLGYRFSKVAIIIFAMIIIGTGTVLAANLRVKSYEHKMDFMTKEKLYREYGIDVDNPPLYDEDIIKKSFGADNKLRSLPRDSKGALFEINDDGHYVFEDGSTVVPIYLPDPDRHEKAKKSGDDAFAELGYPNILPTHIYDNYLLEADGITCFELTKGGHTYKWLMTCFYKDGYESGDFTSQTIWVNFSAMKESVKDMTTTLIDDYSSEDDYIYSTYISKGGILCSIEESIHAGNISANIVFDSDTIGNGHLMLEFVGFRNRMNEIEEILDTLPLIEDMVEALDIED